jgi:hypothetical protein
MSMVIVVGRGHGGTRAISHTLIGSGVYMGSRVNSSGDLMPAFSMYDACRIFSTKVRLNADLSWDFSTAMEMSPPEDFQDLVNEFASSVLRADSAHRGWKLPETVLALPWITQMFPTAKYIYWYRDPRDAILGGHLTDNLADFGVPSPSTEDERTRRAISWLYQYEIMSATPRPANCVSVRFEDFVLKQEQTLQRLEIFLGYDLARVVVKHDAVGRWRTKGSLDGLEFLVPAMKSLRYLR